MRVRVQRLRWWWWNLSLRRKGWVVVGVPLLVLVPTTLGALALNVRQDVVRAEVREVRAVQLLSADVQGDLLDLENTVLLAVAGDDEALAEFTAAEERVMTDLMSMAETAASSPLVDDALVDPAVVAARDHLAMLDRLRNEHESGGRLDLAGSAATADEVVQRFGDLDDVTADLSNDGRDRIDRLSGLIIAMLIGGIVLAAVAAVLMTRLFTRSIVRRVAAVNDVTARVLHGNFDLRLEDTGRDELGVLFEQLREAGALLIQMNEELSGVASDERARLGRERQLRDVLRTVHGEVGQAGILGAVVRELSAALDADRALVMAVEDGKMGSIVAEWFEEGQVALGVGQRLPADPARDANVARMIAERVTLVVDEVATSDILLPQTRDVLHQLGVGSVVLAPVVADEEPLGIIVLLTTGRSRPWPEDAELLVRAVAGEVATALAHARLFEREQEMVERLRELDKTRADFVASVSHELRTPLTSIRGYCEMLEDGDGGELTAGQLQMLGVVQRNADRLLSLIEDLLTLSRIESGSFRVVLSPTDLSALARRTVEELGPQAATHGVTLRAEVDDEMPSVMGEAQQLERILLNLLSNAIKFTPDGGDVDVRLRRDGDEVVLEIADHGIGIPEHEQTRLFSRFFRSSTAQDRAIQGTGLGLVIVKSIIDHHHGRIDVRSALGEGTTFTVHLPVAVASDAEADAVTVG